MRSATIPCEIQSFEPLILYHSPALSAFVEIPAVSLPAPASVSPKEQIISPFTRRGRYFSFCFLDPNLAIAFPTSPFWTPIISPAERLTLAISSATTMAPTAPSPSPPYSCGIESPRSPCCPIFLARPRGYSSVLSSFSARGAISRCPKSFAHLLISSYSSFTITSGKSLTSSSTAAGGRSVHNAFESLRQIDYHLGENPRGPRGFPSRRREKGEAPVASRATLCRWGLSRIIEHNQPIGQVTSGKASRTARGIG